jgi:ATP-dependent RNA helicase DDX49/DBP8
MPLKRKLQPNVTHDDAPKRIRFDEWLSDAEKESDSSNNEDSANQSSGDDSASEPEPFNDQKISKEIEFDDLGSAGTQILKTDEVQSTRFPASPVKDLETSSSMDTATNLTRECSNFMELGVHPSLVTSLAAMSIRKPTSVQASCIPPLLKGEKHNIRFACI